MPKINTIPTITNAPKTFSLDCQNNLLIMHPNYEGNIYTFLFFRWGEVTPKCFELTNYLKIIVTKFDGETITFYRSQNVIQWLLLLPKYVHDISQ